MAKIAPAYSVEEFTASDGYSWRYRRYLPTGESKAELIYLHGIQSHAGWYEYSCARLAQAGLAVSFLDRRGSGMNQERRGDAPSFRRLIDDLAEFVKHVSERNMPVFLVAVSWGGKLAVALQKRHPNRVNGVALLCPGFFAQVRPPLLRRLAIAGSRLFRPTRLFPIPLNDPELFTATPKWLQFLRDDPLALHQATARLLIESVRLDWYLRFVPKHVHVPVLLMLAENDRIIDNERTRRFVQSFASPDKTMVEFPGAYHTLEFEPNPEGFIDNLTQWLHTHIPTKVANEI